MRVLVSLVLTIMLVLVVSPAYCGVKPVEIVGPIDFVENPAEGAFQVSISWSSLNPAPFDVCTVPDGYVLVIERVGLVLSEAGIVKLATTVDGNTVLHTLSSPPPSVPVGDTDFMVTSELTKLYADPGTVVQLYLDPDGFIPSYFPHGSFDISGYLVPVAD